MRQSKIWVSGVISIVAVILSGFPAQAGGFKGNVAEKENPVSIRRQVKEEAAVLIPGTEVRAAVVELAGSAKYIRSIRFADTAPDFEKVIYYKDLSESGAPVYAWCPEDETTAIFLYSDAETVYLNPDSSGMFASMPNLTDISGLKGLDPSRIIDFSGMFRSCAGVTDLSSISGWDVSGGTNFRAMFYAASGLAALDEISGWDLSNGEDLGQMFQSCSGLTTLSGLETWDTSGAKDMEYMFAHCRQLDNLDALADWNVSQAENMAGMFAGCEALASLDGLEMWDVSSCRYVIGTQGVVSGMFFNCKKLADVDGLGSWDVSGVVSFRDMFHGCEMLASIEGMGNWDVSGSRSFYQMFYNCVSLERWCREILKQVTPEDMTDEQQRVWEKAVQEVYDTRCIANLDRYVLKGYPNRAIEELSRVHKEIINHVLSRDKKRRINYHFACLNKAEQLPADSYKVEWKEEHTKFFNDSWELHEHFARTVHGRHCDNCEQIARAFECYVADKLKREGNQSQYLAAHSEDVVFVKENGEKIYGGPMGEERSTINQRFDEMFLELKEMGMLCRKETGEEIKKIAEIKNGREKKVTFQNNLFRLAVKEQYGIRKPEYS